MIKEISEKGRSVEEVVQEFINKIQATEFNKSSFIFDGKKFYIDYHPFDHSDDIIVEEKIAPNYDAFLLVKSGGNKVRIVGWVAREKLMSTPARDIYRNGTKHFVVMDSNIEDLSYFKIKGNLKTDFSINKQKAENEGHRLMINGILAGLHMFCEEAGIYFKDINQKDECIIGDKKVKVYTRDAMSDEDMLIYESYYQKHPEIDLYICCKIKGGKYSYVGFVEKSVVDSTRIVQMIGQDSDDKSSDIRRIFAEQYKNLSELIEIEQEESEEEKISEPQEYVPLHLHSEFSVGDAFGSVKKIAKALKQKGFAGAALTDHGTMAGVWEWQKAMLEQELKPIIGCEIYTKLEGIEKRFHTVVLVKNKTGWQNLLKLQAMACREHFYYKPIVPFEELLKHHEGLIITTGCMGSPVPVLMRKDEKKAFELMKKCKEIFGEDYYAEVQFHTILDNQEIQRKIFKSANELSIETIITGDVHYSEKHEKKYHDALTAINRKKKIDEGGYDDDCFYLMQKEDIKEHLNSREQCHWMIDHMPKWCENTLKILEKCNFQISPPDEEDTLPKFLPSIEERKDLLKKLCIEGLEKNTKYKYEGEIKERLDLEMNRILSKNYENYSLIVYDMIKWSKDNKIRVGPGRGSVGGSLAAYALGITEVDPIEHNLLFDRFLSEIRRDMPDCDLDFMDSRRPEVFEYLKKKYDYDNCAKVITYSRFHPKGILRDIGRIYSIPINEIEKVCSMVIERSGGDARASFGLIDTFDEFPEADKFRQKYPEAAEVAITLEGHIRHKGIHAAAMVISERDISSYLPITRMSGEIVTEWEKQLVEDMKLVKFDILGLKTLSVIQTAIDLADCELPKTYEDEKVYSEIFQKGNTGGVFQIETVGMTKLALSMGLKNFNQLYDCTTLFRPSALHSGQTQVYVNRVKGLEEPEPFHELLRDITKDTQGTIMYQEQIMMIMNQVGKMSWATAEMARKVITKSKGKDAFNKMRAEFVRNANKFHKMPIEEAEKLYDVVSTFGSYGFNKSHAVEYSIISYYCAWLKLYHKEAFFAALLKHTNDKSDLFRYIQDAHKNNVQIEYPDINKSKISYSITENKLYSGFDSIEGIGEKTAQKIVKNQPYESYRDFIKKVKLSSKVLQGLIIADAFRDFGINKKLCYKNLKDNFNEKDNISDDFTDIEYTKLIYQHTTLKPKMDIRETYNFGDYDFVDIVSLDEEVGGKQVLLRGIVTEKVNKDKLLRGDLKNHEHKFEHHMIYLNLNDGTGDIAIQINPWTYEKYNQELEKIEKKPVIVMGILTKDGKKMYGDLIEIIGETNDIKDYFEKKEKGITLASASPAVSKKGKSYYRLLFSNGENGLCFQPPEKLFPGMRCMYRKTKDPFVEIKMVK